MNPEFHRESQQNASAQQEDAKTTINKNVVPKDFHQTSPEGVLNVYKDAPQNSKTRNSNNCIWESEPLAHLQMESSNLLNFTCSQGGVILDQVFSTPDDSRRSSQQLEAKVDMVYSLLAMLGGQENADMGETLLALSANPESCLAMRQSGCLPLLVQLIQSDRDLDSRKKAAEALHNLVHSQPDEKLRKRESRILKLLEVVSAYTAALETNSEFVCDNLTDDDDKHPVPVLSQIMKFSFDEGYRQAICQLGGIHSLTKLVETEHLTHGGVTKEINCNLLRRYACMVLTNLTFGDSGNKALLCSYKEFIKALVIQLQSPSENLRQVTASILRNLSWRADSTSKHILKEVGSVRRLMKAAMLDNKENTLISILSALWNLSAHSNENKIEICSVSGALNFLVRMLSYESSTLAVVENASGILRNISGLVANREDYRNVLRTHKCYETLVNHLKSTSLTIVSNSCGILWNLSSKNANDQDLLRNLGAPSILKDLSNSKHKMIAMGSNETLKNLMSFEPTTTENKLEENETSESTPCTLEDTPLDLSKKRTVSACSSSSKKSNDIKSSSFASLSINNDQSTTLVQRCCSSSLPYVNSPRSYAPAQHAYPDKYEIAPKASEEAYGFNRRYSETRKPNNLPKNKSYKFSDKNKSGNEEKYSMYVETDLDQPTDYSLRYAENDSDTDSDVCETAEKTAAEFVRDTVKTYCTEGTPYETPFNFSTSTSMSDLRLSEKNAHDCDKGKSKENPPKKIDLSSNKSDVSASVGMPVSDPSQNQQTSKIKSEFSSGLISPEKPMNYCEEGTPGYFSRVSSFGSLSSGAVLQGEEKASVEKPECSSEGASPKDDKTQQKLSVGEAKVVKFESNVNYCEETPLMFSRSSSLGSLGSIEQHSIHDDRSSVISDFSRLTSGIISPSELPDSPSQTVPPSPKPLKTAEYLPIQRRSSVEIRQQSSMRRSLPKASVFEDGVTKFKEESTPIQFSMATSLSSLTIDDQDEPQTQGSGNSSSKCNGIEVEGDENKVDTCRDTTDGSTFSKRSSRGGMQHGRHVQLTRTDSSQAESSLQSSSNPYHSSAAALPLATSRTLPSPLPVDNTVHMYCTEDTPAVLSHNGSISDLSLSTLSMLDEEPIENMVYLSENSSEGSGANGVQCPGERKTDPTQIRKENEHMWQKEGSSLMTMSEPVNADGINTPPYVSARDETSQFAVEDSPMQFSLRSSLSNLTIESGLASAMKSLIEEKPTSPDSKLSAVHDDDSNLQVSKFLDTSLLKDNNSSISSENQNCSANVENTQNNFKETLEHNQNESDYQNENQNFTPIEESHIGDQKEDKSEEVSSTLSWDTSRPSTSQGSDPISYGSFKKRKWKWKWMLGHDGTETAESKDFTFTRENSPIGSEQQASVESNAFNRKSRRDDANSKSLDSSYKKKRWWKWRFGSKESEPHQNVPSDVNDDHIDHYNCDKEPQNVRRAMSLDREEDDQPENSAEHRIKSKRWKWKWKFSSKDGDNSKSDKFVSLGLSKLRHTVSPVRSRNSCLVDEVGEIMSWGSHREPQSASPQSSSKKLSRSTSEPRRTKKQSDDTSSKKFTRQFSASPSSFIEADVKHTRNKISEFEKQQILSDETRNFIEDSSRKDQNLSSFRSNIENSTKLSMISPTAYKNIHDIGVEEKSVKSASKHLILVQECLQVSMPLKNDREDKATSTDTSTMRQSEVRPAKNQKELGNSDDLNHMSILEECIQLGMPKKNIVSSKTCDKNIEEKISSCESADKLQEVASPTTNYPVGNSSIAKQPTATSNDMENCLENNACSTKRNEHKSSSKIGKNDLEFLKRQLGSLDKQLVKEAVEKGISKDEEAFLVEQLIMRRVMSESKRVQEATSNQSRSANKQPLNRNEYASNEEDTTVYFEEHLDVVTLSIVKQILGHRFSNEELDKEVYFNDVQPKNEAVETKSSLTSEILDKQNSNERNIAPICFQSKDIIQPARASIKSLSSSNANKQALERVGLLADNDKSHEIPKPKMPITNSTINGNNRSKVCRSSSLDGNQDFASLVEECIQLGMPKKEKLPEEAIYANVSLVPGYTRSNSMPRKGQPSSITILAKNSQPSSPKVLTERRPVANAQTLVEECIKMGMPKKKDATDEVIYANFPISSGYSGSNSIPRRKQPLPLEQLPGRNLDLASKKIGSSVTQPANAQKLVEECIMMGMPRKKQALPVAENSIKQVPEPTSCISNPAKKPDYAALLEECIQLGMPKKNELTKESPDGRSINQRKEVLSISGFTSPVAVKKDNKQNYMSLVEECIQFGIQKEKDVPEEAIYANTTERYSTFKKPESAFTRSPKKMIRSDTDSGSTRIPIATFPINRPGLSSLTSCSSIDNALEDCVKLGWPKKRETSMTSCRAVEPSIPSNYSKLHPVERPHKEEPKNVNVASVARNMRESRRAHSRPQTTATDADDGLEHRNAPISTAPPQDIEETQSVDQEKNGYSLSKCFDDMESRQLLDDDDDDDESEMSFARWGEVDIKLLDPQAMLESLDQYTAELVSQAESRFHSNHLSL